MKEYTLNEVADWIIANRRGAAFVGWEKFQILHFLADAHNERKLYLEYNYDDSIKSLIVLTVDNVRQSLFVEAILGPPGSLLFYIEQLKKGFPNWTIFGQRDDTIVEYKLLWTQPHKAQASLVPS